MLPARRYMALYLPRWATDCLRRADPALGELTVPFALHERQKGAMRLVELDDRAIAAGLFATQSLSDARALCPSLMVREIDRPFLEAVFADFADWHSYASPLVAVLPTAAYGDLVLDITGVSHLFGGEAAMLEKVTARLEGLGFSVAGAVADSIGAAWALAHFAPGRVIAGDIARVLAPLPVAALRLEESQIEGLLQMGLKRVGDLFGRDRKALAARFGASLLLRLDQALGDIEERTKPRLPPVENFAERRFAEPIGLIDDVLMTAHDLAVRLSSDLELQGVGAQGFHLFLYRVDHKVITLSVNAARATRDPQHIARLFSHRAERLGGEYDAGFGIDMIRLAASTLSPLSATQTGAFETRDGTEDLDRLYDRMASRLGPDAISRIKFVNTHVPERAAKLEPVIAKTADDPLAVPDPARQRPLRLLPQAEAVEVILAEVPDGPPRGMIWRRVRYNFLKASGPERIGAEWWRFAGQVASSRGVTELPTGEKTFEAGEVTRDYFVIEDDGGRRFWLFREGFYQPGITPRWFLHGFFA
ncbi:MAG TPA: DNA polymerase Y family protein [Devosiaceae bacterium]|nr:DNA polymerase Y family protein [Devosiaceae bacterium]